VTTSPDGRADGGLGARLGALRRTGRRLLIPYLTSGFPEPTATARLLKRLEDAGADAIELGVPFSDPLADGPTIQRASERALKAGGSLAQALEALATFRRDSRVPVIIFSYLNPVLAYGLDAFLSDAASAGAEGVLLTDLPLDSDPALELKVESAPVALVRLIAPTTPPQRAAAIARRSQGFVYYISRAGVTGARTSLPPGLQRQVAALQRAADIPVCVGFGISTPEQAAAVASLADGIVVGSALIDALEHGEEAGGRFVAGLRRAMDSASG
jgi:tryptophan synthase alpha chain